jgi:hypothetical protein
MRRCAIGATVSALDHTTRPPDHVTTNGGVTDPIHAVSQRLGGTSEANM